jgi:hypothetical protein
MGVANLSLRRFNETREAAKMRKYTPVAASSEPVDPAIQRELDGILCDRDF